MICQDENSLPSRPWLVTPTILNEVKPLDLNWINYKLDSFPAAPENTWYQ